MSGEIDNIDEILKSYRNRLTAVKLNFHRELYNQIDWEDRLICIKGPKGTGKTTMMLQRIKESFHDSEKALYISLDNLWFASHNVMDVVDYHYTHGGTHLFIDEVHYYENWQTWVKNIYDDYPKLNIVYSGSSMLRMDRTQGDLSRRHVVYNLPGLSFREYLEFEGILKTDAVDLTYLLDNHVKIAEDICSKIDILLYLRNTCSKVIIRFIKKREIAMA